MATIRDLLIPFSDKTVKQIPGSGSRPPVDFVSWTDKLQRLILHDTAYEWEIIGFHNSHDEAEPVACHGRLTLTIDDKRRIFDGVGQGRDTKQASSDAFSRACAFAGLGLHLWCAGGSKDGGYWITGVLDKEKAEADA